MSALAGFGIEITDTETHRSHELVAFVFPAGRLRGTMLSLEEID